MARFNAAVRISDWDEARRWLSIRMPIPDGVSAAVRRRLERDKEGLALSAAAAKGDVAAIRRHLQNGADPEFQVKADDYVPPLAIAAVCGHSEAVIALLEGGADIDHRFSLWQARTHMEGATAISMAASFGAVESVRLLADRGARLDMKAHYTVFALDVDGPIGEGDVGLLEVAGNEATHAFLKERMRTRKRPPAR